MALALRRSYRNDAPPPRTDDSEPRRTSPGYASRGATAIGGLMLALARIVRVVTTVVVAIIVAAIVLRLLNANPSNTIVQ